MHLLSPLPHSAHGSKKGVEEGGADELDVYGLAELDRGSEELIVCVNDTEVLEPENSCVEVGNGVVVELTEDEVSVELKDVAVKL